MSRVEVLACLERARCAVSDFQREAKRASQRAAQEQRNALQWERNAMLAVKAGDDALAREVLARKAEHDRLATCHAQHADVLARQLARLSEMLALADSAALNS